MNRLLLALVLAWSWAASAQPILRNGFTTNANQTMGLTSSGQYPLMIDSAVGNITANGILFSPSFKMTGTNATISGNLSLNGRTNRIADNNTTLTYNGVPFGLGTIGPGTINTLPKWTSTNALGNSQVIEYGPDFYDYVLSLGTNNASLQIAVQPRTNTTTTGSTLYLKGGTSTETGGDVIIQGGDGVSNDANGGSLNLQGGLPNGVGSGGGVSLTSFALMGLNASGFDVSFAANAVRPNLSNAVSLGTASLPWGSNYIGTKLFIGTNQYTDNGTNLLRNGTAIGSGSGGITNSGLTLNRVVKATGTNSVGNSSTSDDGTNVTMTEPLLFSADNSFDIGASNATRPRYIWTGSGTRAPDGSTAAPSYAFATVTNTGFYMVGGGIRTVLSGTDVVAVDGNNFRLHSAWPLAWGSSALGSADMFVQREAAAILQLGADSATPIAQTLKGADGSGTNIRGGDTTLGSGRATGTNYGGTIFFATTTPGTTGTGQGIYTNRAWVDGTNGNFNVGGSLVLSAATQTAAYTDNGTSLLRNGVAVGGGSGMQNSTNYRSAVIALTMTGTNVDANQIDWLKTNVCYRLTLTGNAFFGDTVCTNVPDTNSFQWLQLNLVQDGTGARTVTFTNSIFAGVNGTFPLTTNANAWDSLTLLNSPQTNGNVAVLPSNFLHR